MISNSEKVAINIVGGSTFGLYPKISAEKTYNMFITTAGDSQSATKWLVTYAGFKRATEILSGGEGRGIFHSFRGGFAIVVAGSTVYKFLPSGAIITIGNLDTIRGEVSIDENTSSQICIVDGISAYIFHYTATTNTLTKQSLIWSGNPVKPNYVCYMNQRFLLASSTTSTFPQNWYVAARLTDTTITIPNDNQFQIETKPDSAVAIKRIPGQSSSVIVFGKSVAEVWINTGGTEVYVRNSAKSFDNGCVSVNTIAANDELVCWLAQNENSAPFIMTYGANGTQRISTDGIDNLLASIVKPEDSTAFFYRQDGHLFYQLTFFNSEDNLTLIYDFNNGMFFHGSDETLNFHPARQVIYFNEKTYFVSINDAAVYEMGGNIVNYNYTTNSQAVGFEIPRIRIAKTIRKDDSSRFRVGYFTFPIEQGVFSYNLDDIENCDCYIITEEGDFVLSEDGDFLILEECGCLISDYRPRIDMSFSKNGNQSFSSVVSRDLNLAGVFRNRLNWYRMGYANEFTIQLRFWGLQRFVAHDGIVEVFV